MAHRRGSKLVAKWGHSVRRLHVLTLVLIPSLTGVLTGVATIVFVKLLHLAQWLAIGSAASPLEALGGLHWYHLLLVPVVGGLVVGPLVYLLAPEAEGHGVPEVIEAVMLGGGRIRRRVAVIKSIASAVSIGTGGSVGREGPIVQIGAAVGSAIGQGLRLSAEQLKTLVACGAAGGIAAVFNAPIAGAFFALEVITGNFAMPSFGPVILSSVLATVVSRSYFGDYPAFIVQPYALEHVAEIAAYVGLGIACGIVAALFVWIMDRFESLAPRVPIARIWLPAVGGVVLGAMFLLVPNVYGVGYGTMDAILSGIVSWQLLALLLPAKMVATAVTLASGGSGGVFLPSLYIGSVCGGLYGIAVHSAFPEMTAGSGAYALVGMAGVLSAATHSPITSMILLFEVTGDYKIILPVMIVSTLSAMVGRALKEDSLYTLKLSRRGLALHRREDLIMRTHTVAEVMRPAEAVVPQHLPITDLVQYFLAHEAVNVYVVDGQNHLIGRVSIHDIKSADAAELGLLVLAGDLAEPNILTVSPADTLADCMDRFLLSADEDLPVIGKERTLAGVVSRRDVLKVYSSEFLRHEFMGVVDHSRATPAVRESVRLARGLTIARVQTPPAIVGRSLREANLRATYGLTVVGIQREGEGGDQLPDPEVPLGPRDILVLVGRPADIARFG